MRKAARNLRIDMARFESLEALTRVGLDVDPQTRQTIDRGRILREILRQPRFTRRTRAAQIAAMKAVSEGWLDGLAPARAAELAWLSSATEGSLEDFHATLVELRERES